MADATERFARVALPVGVEHQVFTYRVPHGLGPLDLGMRVLVPFGRRRLTGIVVEAGMPCDVEPERVRDIDRVLDTVPTLPAALIELGRFVADYWICPLGEVLRAMHPGGAAGVTVARITDAGRLALGGAVRGQRQRVLLERLADGDATSAALGRGGRGDIGTVLREMASRGWITLRDRIADAPGPASVQVHVLSGTAPLAGPVARRAEAGERLRLLLAEHPEGLSAGELAAMTQRTESSVRQALARLEKQGVTIRQERLRARVPSVPSPRAERSGARDPERRLSPEQAQALAAATGLVDAGDFGVLLIEGVTGSGKTEVYFAALEHAITRNRTGIYLVPEISITPLLMRTVRERFGERTAILHSGLSDGERHDERARILAGEVDVVLGARSAVFAPTQRLGLIVVDEEHDTSYKQDTQPRYHARDVAVMRARIEGAAVLLGSATPSLESSHNAATGRYRLCRMPDRVGGARPASVELVDMRAEWRAGNAGSPFSRRLREALAATLAAGRQVMILLNRRGWADFVLCRECGEPERCDNCAVTLTVHLRSGSLLCHYCDLRRDIPAECRKCGGTFLQNVGHGTQQIEEKLRALLPGVPIGRLDADVARRKGAAAEILHGFEAGSLKVLLGTQMIAKGHDFPNVTLVGVLQADRSLWLPDFRAAERTFQLLVQVAGRAGRGRDAGLVVVQTFSPDHPAIELARTQDYPRFYQAEIAHREALGYPPFRRLVALLVSGIAQDAAQAVAEGVGEALRKEASGVAAVLGPAPAPIARIKGRYRFQLLVKGVGRKAMNEAVRRAVARVETGPDVTVDIDVDPQALL